MYVLRTDNQGKILMAHKGEQSIEPPAGAWAEVISWAAQLDPPVDLKTDFPAGAVLFFDRETLADYCRRYGGMLHATGTNFTRGASVTLGGQQWTSLMRTVAIRPEDEGPRNPTGITADFSILWVPQRLFDNLSQVFTEVDDTAPLWCVSSVQVKRAFVYLDVSGFSKYAPGQEALIINTLVRLVNDPTFWNSAQASDALSNMEAQLCIGDGYIYVFTDPLKATLFAAWMAELMQQLVARREQMGPRGLPVAFHFRMGIHYGSVYRFWDPGRSCWNYIGDGINGGNRVLSVIDKKYDDILFISDAVVNEFIARGPHDGMYALVRTCLESRGRQEDKHGKGWRVFLLNHTQLCEQAVQGVLAR